jgi:hypothetical protein
VTRREIVYSVLRERANEWVSGMTLVNLGAGWRYSARIHELRQAGHVIERRRSVGSAVWEYRLVIEDVVPGQIPLPLVPA